MHNRSERVLTVNFLLHQEMGSYMCITQSDTCYKVKLLVICLVRDWIYDVV